MRSFDARGDGQALDTDALQCAIDSRYEHGGGTVLVSAGRYLTGALFLRDNITLQLEAGATLLASQDPSHYPVLFNRWEGEQQATYAPLIGGENLHNIALIGHGTIDGCGQPWWESYRQGTLAYPRPRLVGFTDCKNVLIENVLLTNSPSWTINPVRCKNVNVRGVSIINPADSPNTDGINPDSCQLVRISDCYISAGDDCIAIKSGTERESDELSASCRDIAITNCTLERGHGGVVIGSEMSGGVQNVVISNCIFIGTDRGIRLKSWRGRGGIVENIRVSNIVMDGVLCPFTMNLYYNIGARGDPFISDKSAKSLDANTPCFRQIHISHVIAKDAKIAAGFIYGLSELPIEDISLDDISVSLIGGAEPEYPEMADGIDKMLQAGFYIRNARRIRLSHVQVSNQTGSSFDLCDSSDVEINACGTFTPAENQPIFRMQNISNAFFHHCRAVGDGLFLQFEGEKNNLRLADNFIAPEQIQYSNDSDHADPSKL